MRFNLVQNHSLSHPFQFPMSRLLSTTITTARHSLPPRRLFSNTRPHSSPSNLTATRRETLLSISTIPISTTTTTSTAAASSSSSSSPSPQLPTIPPPPPPSLETDIKGIQRLAFQPQGWNTYQWKRTATNEEYNINWTSMGSSGPPVLLIHGFGASVYHYRYNIPELAKYCRVYAVDCLGFGFSDKPLVEYNGYNLWTEQIADFIKDIMMVNGRDSSSTINSNNKERVILVGNSLGGYNALSTAAKHPELVKAVCLLNAAGRFEDNPSIEEEPIATEEQQAFWKQGVEAVTSYLKRAVIGATFYWTKTPVRISQVLKQVYYNDEHIDDDLVRSISEPADNPNAPEVFYRIITANGKPLNKLLDQIKVNNSSRSGGGEGKQGVYLLWGSEDPWCVPAQATRIQKYFPEAERTDILSGHCPHDDTPELVNENLKKWIQKV